jgi:hypothetical protein
MRSEGRAHAREEAYVEPALARPLHAAQEADVLFLYPICPAVSILMPQPMVAPPPPNKYFEEGSSGEAL